MTIRSIVPKELDYYYQNWQMSPGLACGDFIFMTGFTGVDADGTVPGDPETQFRSAFRKIGLVLAEAGLTYNSLVEMTSYHIGLRDHLELFKRVRGEFVKEPYPAWTAIEVAGFVTQDALVEIKAVARRQSHAS